MPATNTGLAKVAVQYSADTFVVNQTLVLRINICAKNPPLRQAPKRYWQQNIDARGLFQDTFFAWLFFLLQLDMYQIYFGFKVKT